jgi:DNA-nicking Smr family endonuclease
LSFVRPGIQYGVFSLRCVTGVPRETRLDLHGMTGERLARPFIGSCGMR